MDFSSAFNSIQPHVLIKRLLDLDVNTDLVLWIRQFLCDRPQRVRLNSRFCDQPVLSGELVLNTGVPQGCVLSPVLFSVYTNEYTHEMTAVYGIFHCLWHISLFIWHISLFMAYFTVYGTFYF